MSESTDTECEMFNALNRGGLCVPSDIVIEICLKVYTVMQLLISQKYESIFLSCKNQKLILIQLSRRLINASELQHILLTSCDLCDVNMWQLVAQMLPYFSNILINNYVKERNDLSAASKMATKKRKFATLQ